MTVNIYDCIPTVIDNYTTSGTNTGGSSTTIVRKSNRMIVILDVPSQGTDYAFNVPTDAEVGDIIEIYPSANIHGGISNVYAYLPSGETFINSDGSISHSGLLRKLTSTQWSKISSSN